MTEAERIATWGRVRSRLRVEGCDGTDTSVLPPASCWRWIGAWDRWGFGRVKVAGKVRHVHRLLYEMFIDPIPAGYTLMRLGSCPDKGCVNPTHFEPVPRWLSQAAHPTTLTARNLAKTACTHGHPFNDENTLFLRVGSGVVRACRVCRRQHQARRSPAMASTS